MRTTTLLLGVALAASLQLGSATASDAVQPKCPDMEPSQNAKVTFGAAAVCEGFTCPQNYTITYTYKCDLPSEGKKCVAGQVVLAKIFNWSCNDNDQCFKNHSVLNGQGLVAANCPAGTN